MCSYVICVSIRICVSLCFSSFSGGREGEREDSVLYVYMFSLTHLGISLVVLLLSLSLFFVIVSICAPWCFGLVKIRNLSVGFGDGAVEDR